jgi:hypothetical protein
MTMKKLILAAFASTIAVAAPAFAAPTISISGASGTFGDANVRCGTGLCAFSRNFMFATPAGYNLASATISSIMTGRNARTNIDFTSVTLNGTSFATVSTGVVEFRNLLNRALVAGGTNVLAVSGTGQGSFSGTLSFASGAVPEPAVWGMMILGFGVIGAAMRRRVKASEITFTNKVRAIAAA